MTAPEYSQGVWFIYDGECPICDYAAHALRIKQAFGELHLLDARTAQSHPLLQQIHDCKLDLDEGMVIICKGEIFHGKAALKFMARYGDDQGSFNYCNRILFRSSLVANMLYPWLRGARNALLRLRNKPKIDNLKLQDQPIFQPVFGEHWDQLPPAIKKHYGNRPYSNDRVIVHGDLDVRFRSILWLLWPFFRLLGSVPIVSESAAPVTVHFESAPDSRAFGFRREFHFRRHRSYRFHSRMLPVQGNELVEIMRFGVCWCLRYQWQNGKVLLQHRGYALHWFGHFIPLPLTWLLGRGDAEEWALDDDWFAMRVTLTHPWFGEVYCYNGRFRILKEAP